MESFIRTTCSLDLCTTGLGACSTSARGCCCRAIKTESIDVECGEDSPFSGVGVSTNDTHCVCSVCDDIEVTVSVLVREPGDDGAVISGAQIIDKSTGELLGLTFVNGKKSFTATVGTGSMTIIVVAAGYLPREHTIQLAPTRSFINTVVALLHRNPVPVAPEDSGYTFVVGDYVFIMVPSDGFLLNGTVYTGVVLFDGVFMESSDEGFVEMIDGDQLVLDDQYFSVRFVTYILFTDPDGNILHAQSLHYYVQSGGSQEESSFLTTYNSDSGKWEDLGTFTTANDVVVGARKRQVGTVFVEVNRPIDPAFIFFANLANINCWLQIRSFQADGLPLQGLVGVVEQTGTAPDGTLFTFRFGTNTGAAQSNEDNLVENAICLPVACDGFDMGTVEGNRRVDLFSPLTPLVFPEGTFNASEIGAPIPLGRFFAFQEVTTSAPGQLRPFFQNLSECIAAGMEENGGVADPMNFFYYIFIDVVYIPDNEMCFVKINTIECLQNGPNRVIFFEQGGIQNAFAVPFEELVDEMFSADHFDDLCTPASRVVCIPFECNTRFEVNVRDDTVIDFCDIETVAPRAQSPLVRLTDNPQSILLTTEELAEQDYNNVELGVYYDPNPDVAFQLCLDPSDLSNSLASSLGAAVTFDCLG